MIVLGIETSCDETSAAIVENGTLRSNVTAAQLDHARFGGVVPELASRAHQRLIVPVVQQALDTAGVRPNDLDGIAAVNGPGLAGALLVGLSFGKALAFATGKPFIAVNHMEGHLASNLLEDPRPEYPFLNLTVSGGHTQLVLVRSLHDVTVLGETIDDAAGEAFDKVAKMLGLEYPGGPAVDRRAARGNASAVVFPRPGLDRADDSFSFSGLKTSVLYYLREQAYDPTTASESFIADVCASFQAAVIDVLVGKLFRAAARERVRAVSIAGGVSANRGLRQRAQHVADTQGVRLCMPRMEFCTDNGAMIAMAGYLRLMARHTSSFEISIEPNRSLTRV